MAKATIACTSSNALQKPLCVGDKYHRLTALVDLGRRHRKRYFLFRCDCGNEIERQSAEVRAGTLKSCGCYRRQRARDNFTKHGSHRSPTYFSWQAMNGRCVNAHHPDYADYGGRGILVCAAWRTFEGFLADMGERPAGTTLDRENNDGNYEPGNCRWAPPSTQARNKRSSLMVQLKGERMCLADACELLVLPYATVYTRMRRGQSFEEAISEPSDGLAPDGQISYGA